MFSISHKNVSEENFCKNPEKSLFYIREYAEQF